MNWKPLVKEVNRNFVIRYKFDTDKRDSLKGAGTYISLVYEKAKANRHNPDDIVFRHFNKALNCPDDRLDIRLRGGLSITFKRK